MYQLPTVCLNSLTDWHHDGLLTIILPKQGGYPNSAKMPENAQHKAASFAYQCHHGQYQRIILIGF